MYKVMLVDDDYPTVEFLAKEINWGKLGLELLSTHENGLQAYHFAKKKMPDILITDIGMPKMNGLELIKALKKRRPNLQVALISCHNEFSYAQQAIKLGVKDYLLKESLNPEDMEEVLITSKKRLENDSLQVVEVKQLRHKVKMNIDMENQQLLGQLVQGSSNKILENFDASASYIPVYFLVNDYYQMKKNYHSDDTLQFAIYNVMKEVIERTFPNNVLIVHYKQNKGFLFYPHQLSIKYDSFGSLRDLLQELQQALNHYLMIQVSFLIGDKCTVPAIKQEIITLLNSEQQMFFTPNNSIVPLEVTSSNDRQEIFHYYQDAANDLKKALFQGDILVFKKKLSAWIDICLSKQYSPKIVKEGFLKIIVDVNMQLRTIPYFQSGYRVESIQEEVFQLDTIYEMKGWLINYMEKWLHETSKRLKDHYHKDVVNACYYVAENMEKKLSLDEVAAYLYLNASYFSRLFKKEMQITFVEYVKQRKIDRAKELLEVSDDSVGQICEQLGYDNQSYFIKIFKKQVGCTPLEYRGRIWNGVKVK
ncbi:response regulator [Gracilibacillus sp. S3-1-1]|uniref:Response regulator n=1 Tax=Gracilibacillus pellucidus TaxID=3095368 RepID=A0ACC6M0V8_9BACI|nr:helix-turn-helix domain-containing protein [Gracilibacillus sp. S3-1-1]MDX8044525.1 response regulator [Gracilibacillus sp. S3-1-1]